MGVERIGVIGAGIVGLGVARALVARYPGVEVIVLDKEHEIALHQTSHNSGVVHAGIYYAPGSLKAQLCTRGRILLSEYATDRGIPYEDVGKLVVAADADEVAALDRIEERARANGVPGLRRLASTELAGIEPNVMGRSGLHSPHTAITDFAAVARAYAADVRAANGQVRTGRDVTAITQRGDRVEIIASGESETFDRVVICAGLQSDRVAQLAGDAAEPRIVPFRGEYFRLERDDLVRGLIYPVPDPAYPFLGVHFTRLVAGGVIIGPNAVPALAREGYRWGAVVPADVIETLRWQGFRRLARKHWRMGAAEIIASLMTDRYLAQAQRYVPALTRDDVERAPAGVRAQAVDRDGALVDDFRIHRVGNVIALRNAPSPAATSSLAIGEYVAEQVGSVA